MTKDDPTIKRFVLIEEEADDLIHVRDLHYDSDCENGSSMFKNDCLKVVRT